MVFEIIIFRIKPLAIYFKAKIPKVYNCTLKINDLYIII